MPKLKISILVIASCMLTGCFDVQGVHVLHYWGDNDTGAYRIKMNSLTYALLDNEEYSKMLKNLRSWSRPTTRAADDSVYLEDASGTASMEHFYDSFACKAAPVSGFMDCRFTFNLPKKFGEMPDWSIDWEVVLEPGMRVVSSNHQRTRHESGHDRLIWYFDGNRVSEANVDFTIRTPRAQ
jgi:hypothetical protein